MGASDRASHASSGLTEPGASLPLTTAPATPPYRFLLAWAVGWAVAGALVGGGIAFTLERLGPGPILVMSIVFAEVVGFTALVSARTIFPLFKKLPYTVRLAMQVLST